MTAPETAKKPAYTYVQAERDDKGQLVANGKLKKGMKIGSEVHRDFVLREMNTGDMLDAEREAGTETPLNYNTQVLLRQLVKVGTFDGPFVVSMLRQLSAQDFNLLRDAQAELSLAGEVQQ